MQWQLVFFSLAPLVTFMALRSRVTLQWAVRATLAVSAIEFIYNSCQYGGIEPFSLTSCGLFAVFGGLSLHKHDEQFVKLQPVALEVFIACTFFYYSLALEIPLFAVIVEEHIRVHEVIPIYQRGYATVYATTLSRSLPYLLLVHALATAWAATKLPIWWWFHVRVFGFYAMLGALFLVERLLGVTI